MQSRKNHIFCQFSSNYAKTFQILLRPFPFVQINQIAGDVLGKGRYEVKNIYLSVKVIVQGQGHQEGFFQETQVWNIYQR